MTVRNTILISATGNAVSATWNGQAYTCAAGASITVPEPIASSLCGQGFQAVANTGATSARPKAGDSDVPDVHGLMGRHFYDTTLAALIIGDQSGQWHNPATGAIV